MNTTLIVLTKPLQYILNADLLNFLLATSGQLSIIILLLWLFQKPLRKIAPTRHLVRLLCTYLAGQIFFNRYYSDLVNMREWLLLPYDLDLIKPFHFYIPAKITSTLSAIPAAQAIDWLKIATVIWLSGAIMISVANWRKHKAFRRFTRKAKECPPHIHEQLDAILKENKRWQNYVASSDEPLQIRLVRLEGIASPCTYDTATTKPVIALDRVDYSEADLDSILRHELAHITLKHSRMMNLFDGLCMVYWFNPLMYLARRWAQQQIELDCDAEALEDMSATPKQRVSYARLLVSLAQEQHLSGVALHLSASAKYMQQRTAEILNPKSKFGSILLAVVLVVIYLHTSLFIAWGESPDTRFADKTQLLCLLNQKNSSAKRGMDPLLFDTSGYQIDITFDHLYIDTRTDSDNRLKYFQGVYDTVSLEEDAEVLRFRSEFVSDCTDAFGEPVAALREGPVVFTLESLTAHPEMYSPDAPQSSETIYWPIQLTEEEKELFWDTPVSKVYVVLRFNKKYIQTSDFSGNTYNLYFGITSEGPDV